MGSPEAQPSILYDADAVIVGGGIAGLACAVALAERGVKACVVERAARLGGRAHSLTDEATGDVIDIGPHVVHNEYRNFLAFLERFGTREAITWQPEKVITIATEEGPLDIAHRPLPPPFSLMPDFVREPGLDVRDFASGRRALWRALRFDERDIDELDAVTADEYLRETGATQRMIDHFWRWEAMTLMNVPLERCSAAALMRVHSWIMRYEGLHFGFPAVGLAELYAAPARERIEAAGGRVVTGFEAGRIETTNNAHVVHAVDGRRIGSRFCICALPPRELSALHGAFAGFGSFEPSPYVSVYLWFDSKLGPERFWAMLWSPGRLNYDFYDLSNIRRGWNGRPSVVASNIIYSHRAEGLDDAAIVAATVEEIAAFAPGVREAKVRHAAIHRIPMAIVCPTPGFERMRPATRTAIDRLFLAGDWTRTELPSSMESAARSGFLAAEAVLADLGRREPIALGPREADGLAGLLRAL